MARLERIRKLAKAKGGTEAVQRVDRLMAKEQKRYEVKMGRMDEKGGRVSESVEKASARR